eukprot:6176802-Pleurochrysis_carterae.AAC.1
MGPIGYTFLASCSQEASGSDLSNLPATRKTSTLLSQVSWCEAHSFLRMQSCTCRERLKASRSGFCLQEERYVGNIVRPQRGRDMVQ